MSADRGGCLRANKPHEHSTFRAHASMSCTGCATCQADAEPITKGTMRGNRARQLPCYTSGASSEALQRAARPRRRRHMAFLPANCRALECNCRRTTSSQHPSWGTAPKVREHSATSQRPKRPLFVLLRQQQRDAREEASAPRGGKQGKAEESSEESSGNVNSHCFVLCAFPSFFYDSGLTQ